MIMIDDDDDDIDDRINVSQLTQKWVNLQFM